MIKVLMKNPYIELEGVVTSINDKKTMCKVKTDKGSVYSFYMLGDGKMQGYGYAHLMTAKVIS